MSKKKLLTLEQLVKFCEKNKFNKFSSDDCGYSLSVHVPGELNFAKSESSDLLYCSVRVCHTNLNRNGSFISEENMKKAMPTLVYKPVLASIIETDNGGYDFNSHDMELIEDADGNQVINYIEKQVGTFTTTSPYLEYDEDMDKTYVIAECVIPREYTKTADILEAKGGSKCSCELCINTMSYNAKEKYLELEDFYFSGVTLLGEHIGEGMIGSRVDIADFSTEKNSIKFEENGEITKLLQELNDKVDALSCYTQEKSKEGGNEKEMNKLEELLNKYNKTVEELTFEYEGLSDEDLELAFVEAFEEPKKKIEDDDAPVVTETPDEDKDGDDKNKEDETPTPQPEPESPENEEVPEEPVDNEDAGLNALHCSVKIGENVKEFSVSMNAKLEAISTLVNDTYADDMTWYCCEVFDDDKNVVMIDCWSGKAYRQAYKCKDDVFSLKGDRVEVFSTWMTFDEQKAFESMKGKFEEISDKLAKYEAEPEKLQILESEEYSSIADKEEFAELKKQENHFDLSVDELKTKADEIILAYAKKGALNFASNENAPKVGVKTLTTTKKTSKRSRYGGLGKKED